MGWKIDRAFSLLPDAQGKKAATLKQGVVISTTCTGLGRLAAVRKYFFSLLTTADYLQNC
jgi:hypothetical protein